MRNAPRCGAKTRRGTPYQSPGVPNDRCRMHGGTSRGVPKGDRNAWQHGHYSAESIKLSRYVRASARLAAQIVWAISMPSVDWTSGEEQCTASLMQPRIAATKPSLAAFPSGPARSRGNRRNVEIRPRLKSYLGASISAVGKTHPTSECQVHFVSLSNLLLGRTAHAGCSLLVQDD